jgi:molecular chaperone HscB
LAAAIASHFFVFGRNEIAFCLIQEKLMAATYPIANQEQQDYFALFSLPRKLGLARDLLEQKFLQLSWKLHPDNFVNTTEVEREATLQRSSALNDAYRVLRDPIGRVEYLLSLEGARIEGEKKQQAAPELLEEVFELNESLDELRAAKAAGGDISSLKVKLESAQKNFQQRLDQVDGELQSEVLEWDSALDAGADNAGRQAVMAKLNALLNRRTYIRNLVNGVEKELQ